MANYNTTANVVLSVNGKQAQQVLASLQKDAKRLEQRIAAASTAGDKATMKKLQKELSATNRIMNQLQGSAATTEQVLSRLDKATPRELLRTLRTLQSQLNGIERGSSAWTEHTEKIKRVKAELAAVNRQLAVQQSRWERLNNWLNNTQTFLLGVAGALTGMVMAGRKAVNAYASMEEELANTRKYTGLAEDAVGELNEAFKKLDTRTSREKLNELAQEAGRLGKNTLESVQGYVEAADIINVALVDLGEGATQTIAKLTNIFGVEQMLGTKDAMLAVGSTVNVLSQNCTASKPYLVEFAQRMAGIGSQAGLTIPQILAFGAVLDANGQKVEMSATAIQKVIMNLANKNHEFAATLGLDAEKLNATLKTSAKDGLMMFLQALHDIGEKSSYSNATMVLAPAFKDMGLDAARVSQVLSTLAKHLDEVKWQMGEADKAFKEASSATHEYEIFNNTAQAAIDKAKKRVNELAVELGEKLYPVMKHIYTSSGIFLRVLNSIVSFVIKYHSEIVLLTTAIIAYNVAVNASNILLKAHAAWLAVSKAATTAYRGTVTALNSAHLLLQMGLAKLQGNWARQSSLMIDLKAQGAKLAKGWGVLVAIAITLGAAIYQVVQKMMEQSQVQKDLNEIRQKGQEGIVEERIKINALLDVARDEHASLQERRKAIEALNKIIPDYNGQLDATTGKYKENKKALDAYIKSLVHKYEVEGAKDKLKEIGKERADLNLTRREQEKIVERDDRMAEQSVVVPGREGKAMQMGESTMRAIHRNDLRKTNEKLSDLDKREKAITDLYGKDIAGDAAAETNSSSSSTSDNSTTTTTTTPTTTTTTGNSSKTVDKFAAEKEWRERQEAENRIAYATGKKDYIAYTDAMNQIALDFYSKQLEHTDLSANERLSIEADYYEAVKKQTEAASAKSLDAENSSYASQLADARQFYIDGKYSKETYDSEVERIEIEHQRKLVSLYADGTKERAQAEQQLQSLLIAQMQKRQQKTEELERKYAKMKEDYFGDNPSERQAKYDADFALLKTVYDREIKAAGDNADEKLRIEEAFEKAKAALRKKYSLDAEADNRNSLERMVADSTEWLQGDGGKAMSGTIDTLVSGMSAIFSQLTSIVDSELEIQTAAIEKRYDAEISAAEGNSYKVKKLEAQKEADIAKAKNEANRKQFAMQVIQALAQTAQNALSAYGSAASIPMVGYILAPIAAGMAVAAGMLQVASIKKQQQASEAQGYSEGGFTPAGRKNEAVGVVHAGEWVASQRLVNNPQTRPLLEALDYAQRTNTVGSLTAADVSRSITAPIVVASQPQAAVAPNVVVNAPAQASTDAKIEQTLSKLNQRLNEPFVTVNTVTGDKGINQAQDEYSRLMRNKTPKSRK